MYRFKGEILQNKCIPEPPCLQQMVWEEI